MSHYAQIVEPMPAANANDGPAGTLPRWVLVPGTQIKCVRVEEGGFSFSALLGGEWIACTTHEDLPAFTDKGRSHRERGVRTTLKPGRPVGGGSPTERAIAFRPTGEQRAWLQKFADKHGVSLSEIVRRSCIKLGMPR